MRRTSAWRPSVAQVQHEATKAKRPVTVVYSCTDSDLRFREGRGVMVRAWRFANVAVCRAASNPVWCRIFREISRFSPHKPGTFFDVVCTSPSNASLD